MIRARLRTVFFIFACVIVGAPAWAQWPRYPTPAVPRTADGEPDLEARAPRASDGKPDLTGIWENVGGRRGPVDGQLGRGPKVSPPPGSPPIAHFFDIGAQTEIPYTAWADEIVEQRIADDARGNPDGHCLPMGQMLYHLHPQPRKVIQTPDVIVILNEANSGIRQIFTDGRSLPDNDPIPWWFGYSVGRWEDDTLVVETTGFRDDVWLDYNGSPLTSSGKITERFRRVNFGTLQIDITIEDPKAYTEPFTVRVNQRIMLDTNLIEFVCLENEVSSQYYYQSEE